MRPTSRGNRCHAGDRLVVAPLISFERPQQTYQDDARAAAAGRALRSVRAIVSNDMTKGEHRDTRHPAAPETSLAQGVGQRRRAAAPLAWACGGAWGKGCIHGLATQFVWVNSRAFSIHCS